MQATTDPDIFAHDTFQSGAAPHPNSPSKKTETMSKRSQHFLKIMSAMANPYSVVYLVGAPMIVSAIDTYGKSFPESTVETIQDYLQKLADVLKSLFKLLYSDNADENIAAFIRDFSGFFAFIMEIINGQRNLRESSEEDVEEA